MRPIHVLAGATVALLLASLLNSCGVVVPEDCDENVRRVTRLSFTGPAVIQTTPQFDFAGYDVTIAVDKIDDSKEAKVCFAVRDDDPWYKLFWSVDDVLDAAAMTIGAGQDSRTIEGMFTLETPDDEEVCGSGALPGELEVKGCSGESEAGVYLQPILAKGVESARREIRVE